MSRSPENTEPTSGSSSSADTEAAANSESKGENSHRCLPFLADSVGYKKPPKHGRFKPGQSGNPSGRPKGSLNLRSLLEKVFTDPIVLREGDKTSRVPAIVALAIALRNKGLKGDVRAVQESLKIAKEFETLNVAQVETHCNEFTKEYLERLSTDTIEDLIRLEREIEAEKAAVKDKLH